MGARHVNLLQKHLEDPCRCLGLASSNQRKKVQTPRGGFSFLWPRTLPLVEGVAEEVGRSGLLQTVSHQPCAWQSHLVALGSLESTCDFPQAGGRGEFLPLTAGQAAGPAVGSHAGVGSTAARRGPAASTDESFCSPGSWDAGRGHVTV